MTYSGEFERARRVVQLARRGPDGTTEVLAWLFVAEPGGPAMMEPAPGIDPELVQTILTEAGVVDAEGYELSPDDGEAYVEALTWSFRGSRLWAEERRD